MGGASARRKGNVAETEVVAALRRAGWRAITSRAARAGTQGGSDVVTDFPFVVEVKDQRELRLSEWVTQARSQADGDDVAIVVHKRRGNARAEDWYVTMTFGDLLRAVRPREGDDGTAEPDGGRTST
jgi:hypothetical protein